MKFKKYSPVIVLALFTALTFNANAGSVKSGKAKAAICAACHGHDGIGTDPSFPNLAGQKKEYLAKQLKAFKNQSRIDPSMKVISSTLDEADINNLAAYYSSLKNVATTKHATKAKNVIKLPATDKASEAEFPDTVFITMKKSGTVESFPTEVTWKGGPNMLYNTVTPDGKRVLATSPSENTVYVFDAKDGHQLAVIPVGKAPKGVKVSPDSKFAYVSNQGSAEISVIDLASLNVVDSIKVEEGPHNIRFTNSGDIAYVTLQGGAGIGVIDTKARKMTKVIPVPGITGPHNLDLFSNEKLLLIRDFVHHVAALDLRTEKVIKVIKVGNGHGGIDVAPNDKYAVTGAIGDNYVTVIDTTTLATKDVIVGNGPHGVRASQDSAWIYVTLTKDDSIVVINAKTMEVEKRIAVGKFPFWVAIQGNP